MQHLFSLIFNHSYLLLIISVLKLSTLLHCSLSKEIVQAPLGSTVVLAIIQPRGLIIRDRPSRGQNGE